MGKTASIVALGMSALIAIFALRLQSNSREGLDSTINMFTSTQARLVANSGVEVYLEKMRRDKSLKGTFLDNDVLEGEYDIYITGPDSALTIRSVGSYMDVTHETIVEASREPVPFPNAPGALYVSTAAIQNVKMNGNFTVSGFNHDKDGNLINNSGPNIVPGIAVDNPQDSVDIRNNLGNNALNNITGLGGTPSIRVKNTGINWKEYSDLLAFSADITLGTGIYNGGQLGTYSNPKITLVNGNATFNGNCSGSGILVVNGDLTIKGTFDFRGIIIAYKEATIKTDLNGNGKVIGSLIVSGNAVDMNISNGTFKALYSKEALDNARLNLKSSRFAILSWWE
jgi:hypothetical protein